MKRKVKFPTISRGLLSLLAPLALLVIFLKMLRSQPRTTIKERITGALVDAGLSPILAAFAFAQAAHETGNFTSVVYLTNHNCYGMKMPKVRPTTAKKEMLGYAWYETIEDSAKDYALWYKYSGLSTGLQTIDNFIIGLHNKNYFEAPLDEYIKGVKHFYNMYYGNSQSK